MERLVATADEAGTRVARLNVHARFGATRGVKMLEQLLFDCADALWLVSMGSATENKNATWPMMLHILQEAGVRFMLFVAGVEEADLPSAKATNTDVLNTPHGTAFVRFPTDEAA